MRINQLIALHLNITRKEADQLIAEKKVFVNGQTAVLGSVLSPKDDIKVWYKSKEFTFSAQLPAKIAFYKPPFCFAFPRNQSDPKKKSIFDFLPSAYEDFRPLGNLDYRAEGVQLLANPDIENTKSLSKIERTEEFLLLVDSKIKVEESLKHWKGRIKVAFEMSDTLQALQYLHLDEVNFVPCLITKTITRASFLRQLEVDGVRVGRCVCTRQDQIELSEKWYNDKKEVVIVG